MKANKAIEKAIKAKVKILYKNAILEVKKSCEIGNYNCKIEIINILENEKGTIINKKLFDKLELKGYKLGSTENNTLKNVFWKP